MQYKIKFSWLNCRNCFLEEKNSLIIKKDYSKTCLNDQFNCPSWIINFEVFSIHNSIKYAIKSLNDEWIYCKTLQKHCSFTKRPPFFPNNSETRLLWTETDNPNQLILNRRLPVLPSHFYFVPQVTVEYKLDCIMIYHKALILSIYIYIHFCICFNSATSLPEEWFN